MRQSLDNHTDTTSKQMKVMWVSAILLAVAVIYRIYFQLPSMFSTLFTEAILCCLLYTGPEPQVLFMLGYSNIFTIILSVYTIFLVHKIIWLLVVEIIMTLVVLLVTFVAYKMYVSVANNPGYQQTLLGGGYGGGMQMQ